MRYLEEHELGFSVGSNIVPIVPAAVLFDLPVGDGKIRPNAESGYKACQAASTGTVAEGNVGAGAGATVGKMFGMKAAMKSGIGTASIRVGDTGIIVGAIIAVNSVGDVYDPKTAKIIAGARKPDGSGFIDTIAEMRAGRLGEAPIGGPHRHRRGRHQRCVRQSANHQDRPDGARRTGSLRQSGPHAQRWRYHLRGRHRRNFRPRRSRRNRRASRRSNLRSHRSRHHQRSCDTRPSRVYGCRPLTPPATARASPISPTPHKSN